MKKKLTIQLVDGTSIEVEVKPLGFNALAKSMSRFTNFTKKMQTDEKAKTAFNSIYTLFTSNEINVFSIVMLLPNIIEELGGEVLGLIEDIAGVKVDDIGEIELASLIELMTVVVEVNDFNTIMKLAKNFGGQLKTKIPSLPEK